MTIFSRVALNKLRTALIISKKWKNLKPSIKNARQHLFSKYLLVTNLTISVGFSAIGDMIEQMFEIIAKYEETWNKQRTFNFAATGFPVGILCHYWYMALDKYYHTTTHPIILKKILLSQIVFSPLCLLVFFVTLGILNNSTNKEIKHNLIEKGRQIYLAEWLVWPVASLINFYHVPLRFRILYDNSISLCFDVFNSFIVHKEYRLKKVTRTEQKQEIR
jgi:protein Mpv17